MARCVGIYIGLVIATFIRFSIFCSELYILFSPVAMWYYILFSGAFGNTLFSVRIVFLSHELPVWYNGIRFPD